MLAALGCELLRARDGTCKQNQFESAVFSRNRREREKKIDFFYLLPLFFPHHTEEEGEKKKKRKKCFRWTGFNSSVQLTLNVPSIAANIFFVFCLKKIKVRFIYITSGYI